MEKYGVQIDEEMTKTAKSRMRCPRCQRDLRVPDYCDVCGTEPFETRPKKDDQKK